MIGAALWNVKQTGLDKLPAVREKLADLVCYREGINAHLVAAIAEAQSSPGGLLIRTSRCSMPVGSTLAPTCRK